MAPVFGHGQLRLYLLAILEGGPRSGYDIIRGLEDRFEGLYSPSAGTVYPRLAKLEEEGLIERTDEGRRSIYALLPAGRDELDRRRGDLEEIEESLDESAGQLADEMRERVRTSGDDVRARLEEAARRARERAERSPRGGDPDEASRAWQGSGPWTAPGFGAGLPFGAGSGSAEWVKLARWLAESGIASARAGGWGASPPRSTSRPASEPASDPASHPSSDSASDSASGRGSGGQGTGWPSWPTSDDASGRASDGHSGTTSGAASADSTSTNSASGSGAGASPSTGASSTGPESTGSASRGSESTGSESRGSESRGSESTGSESTGSESRGSESRGSESAGSESPAPASRDSASAGSGAPTGSESPTRPSQASSRDIWAALTDPMNPAAPQDRPRPPAGSADSRHGGSRSDDRSGSRRGHGGWEDLLEGAMPDAEQMREISEIIRSATAQIQEVLRRRQP